jgi:hypothetical protein
MPVVRYYDLLICLFSLASLHAGCLHSVVVAELDNTLLPLSLLVRLASLATNEPCELEIRRTGVLQSDSEGKHKGSSSDYRTGKPIMNQETRK